VVEILQPWSMLVLALSGIHNSWNLTLWLIVQGRKS
jgi:hypothetical protein